MGRGIVIIIDTAPNRYTNATLTAVIEVCVTTILLEDKMSAMAVMRFRWVRCFLAVFIAITLALAATPAEACGCGIYLPLEGEASVSEEHVLIRWDGQTEDIVMTLGVLGSSKEAAVIFPVPTRATVKLADGKVFDALRDLTKPLVKNVIEIIPMIAFGGAARPPVTLLERQTLGPFDVSTLAATDANALGDWLSANGYNLPPEVINALKPYVDQNWYYIAVRLSPEAGEDGLTGALDPLWITFPYDKIVYPMRPSALARNHLTVFMYILADHRVQKPISFGHQTVEYADWVDPATLEKDSPLLPFVPKKLFLTKIVESIYQPETITDDFFFEFATEDEIYHSVEYHHVYGIVGIPFCILIPCSVGLIILVSVLVIRRKSRRERLASTKT